MNLTISDQSAPRISAPMDSVLNLVPIGWKKLRGELTTVTDEYQDRKDARDRIFNGPEMASWRPGA